MVDTKRLLSTVPIKPSAIPSEEQIIAAGRELIQSTYSWKPGKTYFTNVKTFSQSAGTHDTINWHCRVSEHPRKLISFDQLWDKLSKDKAINEKEFISLIDKATKVHEHSPTAQIWTLHYKFSFPISNRVFTVLQVTHIEDTALPSGLIVSIPIDLSSDESLMKLEEEGVKAHYVSVEQVKQLENGDVEWRMATSSDFGGLMPKPLVELGMPKSIAQDVPHFLHWFETLPKSS